LHTNDRALRVDAEESTSIATTGGVQDEGVAV
jgi:hypothetical protein